MLLDDSRPALAMCSIGVPFLVTIEPHAIFAPVRMAMGGQGSVTNAEPPWRNVEKKLQTEPAGLARKDRVTLARATAPAIADATGARARRHAPPAGRGRRDGAAR